MSPIKYWAHFIYFTFLYSKKQHANDFYIESISNELSFQNYIYFLANQKRYKIAHRIGKQCIVF